MIFDLSWEEYLLSLVICALHWVEMSRLAREQLCIILSFAYYFDFVASYPQYGIVMKPDPNSGATPIAWYSEGYGKILDGK